MCPLTTARLNAEHGCCLDLDRALATWFGDGEPGRRPWKVTADTRSGSVTCDGLDGADWFDPKPGFHASIGSLQGPGWLGPVAAYDPESARDIGRHVLHAALSAWLLQGFGLDREHRNHKDWRDHWDSERLFFYEALTSWG